MAPPHEPGAAGTFSGFLHFTYGDAINKLEPDGLIGEV